MSNVIRIKADETDDSDITNIKAVKDAIGELKIAYIKKQDMADSYKDVIKAVAEKAHIDKAVLSKYVKALVDDTIDDDRNKAQQLEMLFYMVVV